MNTSRLDVRVDHVSCRSSAAVRADVVDAVEHLDVRTGLSPTAILAVRRASGTLVGFPGRVSGIDLRDIARRAHRPSSGTVPAGCDAVVFADEADLLRCLAVDAVGSQGLRWWWKLLLGVVGDRPLTATAAVRAACGRYSHALPAAARTDRQAIAGAIALLDDAALLTLASRIAKSHGATTLATVFTTVRGVSTVPTPQRADRASRSGDGHHAQVQPPEPAVPPSGPRPGCDRHGAGMHIGAGTGSDRRLGHTTLVDTLVDVWVFLSSHPAQARTDRFAAHVTGMLTCLGRPTPITAIGPERAGRPDDAPARPSASGVPPRWDASKVHDPVGKLTSASRHDVDDDERADTGFAVDDRPWPTVGSKIETDCAGLFYLLQPLASLGLPATAAGPGEPGPLLARWHLLAMLAERWCPTDDPVHDVVADLAGPIDPALDDPFPWNFRLPRPLDPNDSATLRWTVVADRLLLVGAHSGLVVTDVALPVGSRRHTTRSGDHAAVGSVLDHELSRLRRRSNTGLRVQQLATGPSTAHPPDGRGAWVVHLAATIADLLRRHRLNRRLVRVPGTIESTGVSVTVTMPIDAIDIDVRRAGFDANPGWVPELGRTVELVFE